MIIEDFIVIQKKLAIMFIVGMAFSLIGRGLMALGISEEISAGIGLFSLIGFAGFEIFMKKNYSLGVCQGICAFLSPMGILYFIFKNEINLPAFINVFLLSSLIVGLMYMVWCIFTKTSEANTRS
jgi:hypothetical protein